MKWEMFPESIGGMRVSASEAEKSWQFVRLSSFDWNCPPPMLHMLIESNPEGARLQKPVDVFRIASSGSGIEFIKPHDGKIDMEISRRFTLALRKAGFVFPVRAVGGNPDVRKRYDAGYFLADSKGAIFQMQLTDNQPSCRMLRGKIDGAARYIHVKEHHRKEYYGFVVTDRGSMRSCRKMAP